MNKIFRFFFFVLSVITFSCAENVDKQALPYLLRAKQSYSKGQYALAKLQIDSIKQIFPKAFETRAEAVELLVDVELAESYSNKEYTDSMLDISYAKKKESIVGLFLDKDADYQDVGVYYAPRHRIEQCVGRTYLRPQTDELGNFSIVAFCCGRSVAPHTLRFTVSDGSYVEMHAASEIHVMSTVSGRIERVDFSTSTLNDIAAFMDFHAGSTITATLIGEKGRANVAFGKNDVQNLKKLTDCAKACASIIVLEKEQQQLERRIAFFKQRDVE